MRTLNLHLVAVMPKTRKLASKDDWIPSREAAEGWPYSRESQSACTPLATGTQRVQTCMAYDLPCNRGLSKSSGNRDLCPCPIGSLVANRVLPSRENVTLRWGNSTRRGSRVLC